MPIQSNLPLSGEPSGRGLVLGAALVRFPVLFQETWQLSGCEKRPRSSPVPLRLGCQIGAPHQGEPFREVGVGSVRCRTLSCQGYSCTLNLAGTRMRQLTLERTRIQPCLSEGQEKCVYFGGSGKWGVRGWGEGSHIFKKTWQLFRIICGDCQGVRIRNENAFFCVCV